MKASSYHCPVPIDIRSLKAGNVSEDEIRAIASRFHEDHKTRAVLDALKPDSDSGDVCVATGDLHITGDLNLFDRDIFALFVDGSLTVDGLYADCDHPASYLLVTGDMRARDVITGGWLEVHGDLTTGNLIGNYNDCSAFIGGDVRAELFYGEEHFFTIRGAVHADVVIGAPRLDVAVDPLAIGLDDPQLLDHLDRELLGVEEEVDDDGSTVLWIDGIEDFDELKRRVAAGQPLRTPNSDDAHD